MSSSNVVGIGNAAANPNNVLEQAKGEYESLVIIGYDNNGVLDCRASTNLNRMEILWLIEKFKQDFVLRLGGEDD